MTIGNSAGRSQYFVRTGVIRFTVHRKGCACSVVNLIDYSDIDKMMDISNEKC